MGFMPLVPDDEHDLYERMLALKHWASGFLTGIGVADMSLTDAEQEESLVDWLKSPAYVWSQIPSLTKRAGRVLLLFEFARMMPVSLAALVNARIYWRCLCRRLAITRQDHWEVQAQSETPSIPLVVDAMNYQRPS